ncbi:hypothetical protein DYI24_23510 [Rhodopseudomonas sp. BR0C11]|uniref:hypothetical protein n=1 Tax=Rhodopseudomonas sp. BR0C11 TaxID=2269370 RepID=UPI0013E08ADF|nr:hypothetical protein [Rhodopseudomonas sp. BR0C11]NEV80007.1 hypothetical protein [Rhodopseudomonas sp. BR0C11]
MMRELQLAPLYMTETIPSWSHGVIVEHVEKELSFGLTVLAYVDDRGAEDIYHHRMIFRRTIESLPKTHLLILKWIRMLDYANLIQTIMDAEQYKKTIAQFYVGVLNGDGSAAITFIPTKEGGSWFEENREALQKRCAYYYTPEFVDVVSEAAGLVDAYINAWPDTPMADFARSSFMK